ncbi:MAG: type VI secretion system-associated protein TagF [Loktanella sp.]|nr:type VI secretion system-associated protein TagF [Loktanella sp.]
MTNAQGVVIGLMGKHPGYGDFLQVGVSEPVAKMLIGWIDHSFNGLRDSMGNDWPAFWDHAQDLRFWVGAGWAGRTLAGVLRPSRDKVGRRYPLLLFAEGALVPPPITAPDQQIWETLDQHMADMQAGQGGRALLEGLSLDLQPEPQAVGPTIWAHRNDGHLTALFQSAGPVDAARAQLIRSHWWAPGHDGKAAVWLACPGLPQPQALAWLLGGVVAEQATPQDPLPEIPLPVENNDPRDA